MPPVIAKPPIPFADDPAARGCLPATTWEPGATTPPPCEPAVQPWPRFDLPHRRWGVTLSTVGDEGRHGIQHFTVCAATAEEALAAAAAEAGTEAARRHRHGAVVDLTGATVAPGEPSARWPDAPPPA